jgi:hypothetical protein
LRCRPRPPLVDSGDGRPNRGVDEPHVGDQRAAVLLREDASRDGRDDALVQGYARGSPAHTGVVDRIARALARLR